MAQPSTMLFPSVGMHVLSAIIHLVGVSILAHIISRRTMLRSNLTLKDLSWPWICVLLLFVDSWLFIFASGVLILGFGLEKDDASCSTGILLCIIFYGSSKLFIYIFLTERVHVVWRPTPHSRRLQSKAYIACLIVLSGYSGVVGVLFYGRISFFGGERGACYIGLKKAATVALLTYDFIVNAFLTGLFLWPVMRSSFRNVRIRRLAMRTLWSALIALSTSCVNILILTLMHGRQLGWVCLGSCGTDVIINALVIHWVTSQSSDQYERSGPDPDIHSPSKSEEPVPTRTEPSTTASRVMFKLGPPKQTSPTGVTSMQIKVTTERVDEHGQSSGNESEYELQKVPSISPIGRDGVREERRNE